MSQASSENSEGGWVDLFDDEAAGHRLQKRAQRQLRHETRRDKQWSQENEGGALLHDMLAEVEIDAVRIQAPRRPKRSRSKAHFAKALRRCGDAPPEKFEENWKQMLQLQYEQGQKSLATRGAKALAMNSSEAAAAMLSGLDGLGKVTKNGLDRAGTAASHGVKRRVGDAERLRERLREEGLVQMVQNSKLGRRQLYGLDDDEDSIYDLDELRELGDAELSLLDAIGSAEEAAGAVEQQQPAASTADAAPRQPAIHGELNSARLEALSTRLASRRDEKRRIKLL